MHIVLFSPIPFDDLHQRPQKLAELLAARGARVIYVEPTGVRDALRRGVPSFLRSLLAALVLHVAALPEALGATRRSGRTRARGATAAGAGLEVVQGPLSVPVHRSGAAWINAWTIAVHRRFLVREILARLPADADVAALVEFPFWGAVLEPGDFEAVFYDCLDDFASFVGSNSPQRFTAWERRLTTLSHGAFASARALEDWLHSLQPALVVHRAPNGVDVDWFRERAERAAAGPSERGRSRPVAGYVGVIGRWLDYTLLDAAIAACPEVDFVFVGPVGEPAALDRLRRHANFRWIARRPYDEIPGLVRGFDACLIPFARGRLARSTNPVKVFEYFALGKPVVTTPLDELEVWRSEHLVYWAEDAAAFATAVRDAVREQDAALRARRVDVARANTWKARAAEMLATIETTLRERAAARVAL